MAKDIYHNLVKLALERDGWLITHDPFNISDITTNIDYDIDLGAEKLIAAERGSDKIAVEVKSFLRASISHEFHSVFGQYLIYLEALKKLAPERILLLAMPNFAFDRLQEYPFILEILNRYGVNYIVFDANQPNILEWKR
jgi:hypothetical protein